MRFAKSWPSEANELLRWGVDRYGPDVRGFLTPGEQLLGLVDVDVLGRPRPPRRLLPKRSLLERITSMTVWDPAGPFWYAYERISAGRMMSGGWESTAGRLVVAAVAARRRELMAPVRGMLLAFTPGRLLVVGRSVTSRSGPILLQEYPRGEMRLRAGWVPNGKRDRIDVEFSSDGSWLGLSARGPEGVVLAQELLAG